MGFWHRPLGASAPRRMANGGEHGFSVRLEASERFLKQAAYLAQAPSFGWASRCRAPGSHRAWGYSTKLRIGVRRCWPISANRGRGSPACVIEFCHTRYGPFPQEPPKVDFCHMLTLGRLKKEPVFVSHLAGRVSLHRAAGWKPGLVFESNLRVSPWLTRIDVTLERFQGLTKSRGGGVSEADGSGSFDRKN